MPTRPENKPDYRLGDDASSNDGRVTAWGLTDVAYELRTANLIEMLKHCTRINHAEMTAYLTGAVMDRLDLIGMGDKIKEGN